MTTSAALHDCRDSLATTLETLAAADERTVVVVNDSVGSSRLTGFARRFPDRLIDVGIAEADLVGVAAGLASSGRIAYVCAASSFLTTRALEQIKVDVAYSNANVKLCGMSSGVAYGELGATHHSLEDIATLRALAGLRIAVPADPTETAGALVAASVEVGPVYLRVSRMPVPAVHPDSYTFAFGRAVRLREGSDVTIIANGTMVSRALRAAERLADTDGIQARVVSMASIDPLDTEEILSAAGETGAIVTVEEHSVRGGLGGAVAEVVATTRPVAMRILGAPPVFLPTGSAEWLLDYCRLTPEGICDAVHQLVGGESS